MKDRNSRYELTQCALYKCRNKRRLAAILGIEYQELSSMLKQPEKNYRSFPVDKPDGDKRNVSSPSGRLKKVQKRVHHLLARVNRPEWLISGERGKSYITNGAAHLGANYLLAIDIRKFYDNCKREYVYIFLRDTMLMEPDVAELLTDIVTFGGGIPTGSSTSQVIAFYAYHTMFESIRGVAEAHGCKFTLYVDDMTFSSAKPFNPRQLQRDVDIELRKYSHKVKYSKVRYYTRRQHKLVTGVVISRDHRLVVANRLREKVRRGVDQVKKSVDRNEVGPSCEAITSSLRLRGQVQAARNVEKSSFPEVLRLVERTLEVS